MMVQTFKILGVNKEKLQTTRTTIRAYDKNKRLGFIIIALNVGLASKIMLLDFCIIDIPSIFDLILRRN